MKFARTLRILGWGWIPRVRKTSKFRKRGVVSSGGWATQFQVQRDCSVVRRRVIDSGVSMAADGSSRRCAVASVLGDQRLETGRRSTAARCIYIYGNGLIGCLAADCYDSTAFECDSSSVDGEYHDKWYDSAFRLHRRDG